MIVRRIIALAVTIALLVGALLVYYHHGSRPPFVGSLAYSPGADLIASDCGGYGVWVWRLRPDTGECWRLSVPDWRYHNIHINTLQFSAPTILCFVRTHPPEAKLPPEVVLWDVINDREVRSTSFPYWPTFFAIAPSAHVAVLAPNSHDKIALGEPWSIIDLKSGFEVAQIPIGIGRGEGFASQVELSRDGKRLAASIYQKGWKAEIWDIDTRVRIFQSDTHTCCSMSHDGNIVALSSADDFTHEFWNLRDNLLIAKSDAPLGYVHLFPDGRRFLADSHSLEVWDTENAMRAVELAKRSQFHAHNVHISPNGHWLAAAAGSQLREWDSSRFLQSEIQ